MALGVSLLGCVASRPFSVAANASVDQLPPSAVRSRLRGLVYGGVLGDALGGPVEFQAGPLVDAALPGLREWPDDRVLRPDDITQLAQSLPLLSYETLRPGTEPYGQWTPQAPAGTTTDDTRHKIVLMRMLQNIAKHPNTSCRASDLAKEYLRFHPIDGQPMSEEVAALCEEGMREYRYAAQWLLGNRDLKVARPVERIWSGIDNCSGQMLLTPLAAVYAGRPEEAYRAAYALDFVDTPGARDMASALVAGLAAVLVDNQPEETQRERWQRLLATMRTTDPYGLSEVPFAGRPLHRWMDLADALVRRAHGSPRRVFELLETEGQPHYWWDAHFTLLVPIVLLQFCDFDPLAALHMTLDFRHDTDSYAQVLGAMAGAVCGEHLFPVTMRDTIRQRQAIDHGEDLDHWCEVLSDLGQRSTSGQRVVMFLEDGNGN